MFTDPQTITTDGAFNNLPRVSSQGRASTYESADGGLTLSIAHTNGKRTRSVVRLDRKKVASDPLNPSTNRPYSFSTYLVVDCPVNVGFTDDELQSNIEALVAKISEEGFLAKFLGQES